MALKPDATYFKILQTLSLLEKSGYLSAYALAPFVKRTRRTIHDRMARLYLNGLVKIEEDVYRTFDVDSDNPKPVIRTRYAITEYGKDAIAMWAGLYK